MELSSELDGDDYDDDNCDDPYTRSSRLDDSDPHDQLPRHVRDVLVKWGVMFDLAALNIQQQITEMVGSNTSFHSWWTAHKDLIANSRVYFEGLVLSVILDHADQPEVWQELAARRWFCLWLVSQSMDWDAAQAFLPLTMTQGLTALQQQLIARYTRLQTNSRPTSSSASSSYRGRQGQQQRQPKKGKKGQRAGGDSAGKSDSKKKKGSGAATTDNTQSADSSAQG